MGENHLLSSSKYASPCPFLFSSHDGRIRGEEDEEMVIGLSSGESERCVTLVVKKGLLRRINR